MGCYTSKPKFSTCSSKKEILDLLIQEKDKYKKEVTEMKNRQEKVLLEVVSSKEENESKGTATNVENVEKEKPLLLALSTFTSGLDDVEGEIRTKEITDVQGLGKLLDEYFSLGEEKEKDEVKVKEELERVKVWLSGHVRTS